MVLWHPISLTLRFFGSLAHRLCGSLDTALLFGLCGTLTHWLPGFLGLWLLGSRKGLFEYSQRAIGVIVHLSHLRLRDETKAEAEQKLGL